MERTAIGVFACLFLRSVGIDGEPLRFDDSEGACAGIPQQIVRPPIRRRFFRGDLRFVGNLPSCFFQQLVDHHSGIGFSGHRRLHFHFESAGPVLRSQDTYRSRKRPGHRSEAPRAPKGIRLEVP